MWLNYDDKYCVSDEGLVMNRATGKILKPSIGTYGYFQLDIYQKTKPIHYIIAKCFLPKIDLPNLQIDHINQDKTDNRPINLRWCSKSQNMRNRNYTNISKTKDNTYRVVFYKSKQIIYRKVHKTLEEATEARDAFKLTEDYKL